MWGIDRLSRITHDLIFKDTSESFCSRAWRKQDVSRFWKAWTYAFGRRHCAASFERHWLSHHPQYQTDPRQSH